MKIKDIINKDFSDNDKIILKRFKSSKFIFIIMSFIFFINFFLLSNFPQTNILGSILPITYVSFITWLLLITYYSLKIKFKEKMNSVISIIVWIILIILWIIFSIPFLIDYKTLSNLI